jgi:phospholipase/carboxylesterase
LSPPSKAGSPISARADLPVLIAHGRRDPVIDVEFGRRARDLLESAGLAVDYLESEAGHHIDPSNLVEATRWVASTVPA